MNRHRVLGIGGIVLAVGAGFVSSARGGGNSLAPAPLAPAPLASARGASAGGRVAILHTNDLHDQILPFGTPSRGGLARLTSLLRERRAALEAQGIPSLTLDAGDQREGTLFYEVDRGALVWRLLRHAGFDAVEVGNHDYQFGVQRLYDDITRALGPDPSSLRFLWGNVNPSTLTTSGGGGFSPVSQEAIDAFENGFADVQGTLDPTLLDPPFAPSHRFQQALFFQEGAIRVGVFGVTTDEILYTGVPGDGLLLPPWRQGTQENLTFYDALTHPSPAAFVSYLEDPDGDPLTPDGADVIVCLSHLGVTGDLQLASSAIAPSGRAIDLIVGGHSHTKLNRALPVSHPDGTTTWIVQAGSQGAWVGEVILDVGPGGGVSLVQSGLHEVREGVPPDPVAEAWIQEAKTAVQAAYRDPFDRVIARSIEELPDGAASPSGLGRLVADAFLDFGRGPGGFQADAAFTASFFQRQRIFPGWLTRADVHDVLPLHELDRSAREPVRVGWLRVKGGLVNAPQLQNILALVPGSNPPSFQNVSRLELLLEALYSLDDLMTAIGNVLGFSAGGVDAAIRGLQASGISFVVDGNGPLFERIDPTTIVVGGEAYPGAALRARRIAMDSILVGIGGPFLGGLIVVEDPPGSGQAEPLVTVEPHGNFSSMPAWLALERWVRAPGSGGGISPDRTDVTGNRIRTLEPDLTHLPSSFQMQPAAPAAGDPVTITIQVRNHGLTPVLSADVDLRWDPTPWTTLDDPDGYTDAQTGFVFPVLASASIANVPPWDAVAGAGIVTVSLPWTVPAGTPAARYPFFVEIRNVVEDPAGPGGPETVLDNNQGAGLVSWVEIQGPGRALPASAGGRPGVSRAASRAPATSP